MSYNSKMIRHKKRLLYVAIGSVLFVCIYLLSLAQELPDDGHTPAQDYGRMDSHPRSRDKHKPNAYQLQREVGAGEGVLVELWPKEDKATLLKPFEMVPRLQRPQEPQVPMENNPDVVRKPEDANAISEDMVDCGEGNTECNRFRTMLSKWPSDKPKAAFYFLTKSDRLRDLRKALSSVDKSFNDKYKYPIIIFHEEDLVKHLEEIRTFTLSDVYFQQISFILPDFITDPVVFDIPCLSRIGYRHMCRFHAKGVYQQPIIRGLEYYWRLDDDSLLLSDVPYDVFTFMRDREFVYGYSWKHFDNMKCTLGLWDATRDFINKTHLQPQFFDKWKDPQLYYNNFEISKLSVWLSRTYADYIEHIDRLGGIFYHRWGDAPIKAIAISLLVPENKVHHFQDIGYQHRSYVNWANSTSKPSEQ